MKIKVSFIGAGYMADAHAQAINDDSRFYLSGVYSKNQESSSKFAFNHGIEYVAKDISDLFNYTHSDLVIVAVPELALPQVLEESFSFPWLHLIEKPLGVNYAISEYLVKLMTNLNAKAFIGLNRRFYSGMLQLKARVAEEKNPILVMINDQEDQIAALRANQPPSVVENWAFANSIHLIDLFIYFCRGEILEVSNRRFQFDKNFKFINSTILFSSGDVGIYNAIWNKPGPWSLSCNVADEYWEMKPLESTQVKRPGQNYQEIELSHWDRVFKPGIRQQIKEIYDYFDKGFCNLPSISDALKTMKLIDSIYE